MELEFQWDLVEEEVTTLFTTLQDNVARSLMDLRDSVQSKFLPCVSEEECADYPLRLP